jgi:hypothetical protein
VLVLAAQAAGRLQLCQPVRGKRATASRPPIRFHQVVDDCHKRDWVNIGCGGAGGGTGGVLPNPDPVPVIAVISPASAASGSVAFTLTATGTNFISSSQVAWNAAALMEEMVFRRTSLKDLILAQPGPDSLNVRLANCYFGAQSSRTRMSASWRGRDR